MIQKSLINKILLLGLGAIVLTACATRGVNTTEDDVSAETSGESPTGVSIGDTGASARAISDENLTAREMLDQSDSELAKRIVYFEFDSAKLSDEALSIVAAHGAFIAKNSNVDVRVEGHADERGSREYNIAIGDRRAQSVRRVLLLEGAPVGQIETISYGEELPAMAGQTEAAWDENRRVELIYIVK